MERGVSLDLAAAHFFRRATILRLHERSDIIPEPAPRSLDVTNIFDFS
jgi:hypothetical protein